MQAIIETGGKQYRVAPGGVIRVEKLSGDVGSEIELPLKAVFKDDQDRINFLNTLQHVNKRYNWLCHAYCMMATTIIS